MTVEPAADTAEPISDEDLFRREMEGVRILSGGEARRIVPRAAATPPRPVGEVAEVMAELADLVRGDSPLDTSFTEEFVQGAAHGVDTRLVRRLRRGALAHQAHVDLHGLTTAEAREELGRFLATAEQRQHRCVLIIHGRGLNSHNRTPVLKRHVVDWLSRGPWARSVLAFATARPCDGGAGALYVLLRRRRSRKVPIRVMRGAGE